MNERDPLTHLHKMRAGLHFLEEALFLEDDETVDVTLDQIETAFDNLKRILSETEQITDTDVSIMLFQARMAQNDNLINMLGHLIESVNEARGNNLDVTLYRDNQGEISYEVHKRRKMGFPLK